MKKCVTVTSVNSFVYTLLLRVVYYLKATFGSGTGDAVMEIPVSITGYDSCLTFEYQISSPRIELIVYTLQTGRAEASRIGGLKYTDQWNVGRWNEKDFGLNYGVEAIQLVAKKTGVTTSVEYVLVDVISIDPCFNTLGKVPVFVVFSVCHYVCLKLITYPTYPSSVLRVVLQICQWLSYLVTL